MSRTFAIALPDDLEQRVMAQATRLNQSPETVMVEAIAAQLTPPPAETDPLLALIGSLSSETPDLAEQHDRYLGEAIARDLHRAE